MTDACGAPPMLRTSPAPGGLRLGQSVFHNKFGEGVVKFTKDHDPRHFRYGIFPVTKFWNPQNKKLEEMTDAERPMVFVRRPVFSRERWTHVLITFAQLNSGQPDGRGTLYLDGEPIGATQRVVPRANGESDEQRAGRADLRGAARGCQNWRGPAGGERGLQAFLSTFVAFEGQGDLSLHAAVVCADGCRER